MNEDGSSVAQSQINEEDEESKHGSSSRRDYGRESKNSQVSEDVTSGSDEEDDDEDILIQPKDLIVSFFLGHLSSGFVSSNLIATGESGWSHAARVT